MALSRIRACGEQRKSIYKLDRLEELQASARLHLARATAQATDGLGAHCARQAARGANVVAEAMGYGGSFHSMDDDTIRRFVGTKWSSGESYSQRVWGNADRLAAYVQGDMAKALARGESYQRLADAVSKRFVGVSESSVMRLVYTEGTYVSRQAQLAELAREGFEEYRVEPIGDERTCSECSGLTGKTFRVEDAMPGVNLPPIHPNCRCQIAPAVDDWDAWTREQIDAKRAELAARRMTEGGERAKGARAVQDECGRIESDFGRVWRDYRASGKSRKGYDETVNAYLSSISDGHVSAEYKAKPKAKEIQAVTWLSANGSSARFNCESSVPGSKNPDLTIDGNPWEIKRIETSSLAKAKKRVGSGLSQSKRIVIDLSLETLSKNDEKALVDFVLRLRDTKGLIVLHNGLVEIIK
ncbi:SPP1 gp7 family putative phage head morphogenesis protein [Olsenella profusa DSM 13989]|uniref:minor capsid protein n=1 Tax=Olsenella profusa TaxID=138595 RepID=UPI0027892439|nr:minor capsid protein [Olsenella profusa]MDP9859853.1 SPP1 gp7 family putative phage head morphogenesis protein [Olsenella profusa DSM 13989]